MQPKFDEIFLTSYFFILIWIWKQTYIKWFGTFINNTSLWCFFGSNSIHLIIGNRETQVLKMHSNLMSSSCFRIAFYNRVVTFLIIKLELENSCWIFSFEFVLKRNILFVGTLPKCIDKMNTIYEIRYFNFVINDAWAFWKITFYSCIINFRYLVSFH